MLGRLRVSTAVENSPLRKNESASLRRSTVVRSIPHLVEISHAEAPRIGSGSGIYREPGTTPLGSIWT